MKKLIHIPLIALSCLSYAQENTPAEVVQSGNWSNVQTWGFSEGTMSTTALSVSFRDANLSLNADVDATITSLNLAAGSSNTLSASSGNKLLISGLDSSMTSSQSRTLYLGSETNTGSIEFGKISNNGLKGTNIVVNGGDVTIDTLGSYNGAFRINNSSKVTLIGYDSTYNASGSKTYITDGTLTAANMVFGLLQLSAGSNVISSVGLRILNTDSFVDGNIKITGSGVMGTSIAGDDGVTYNTRKFSLRFGNGTNETYANDANNKMTIGATATIDQRCTKDGYINDILCDLSVSAATGALKMQSQLHIAGNGKLTLNTKNAFSQIGADGNVIASQDKMTLYLSRHYNDASVNTGVWAGDVTLALGADNEWGQFLFGSDVNLNLELNGYNLTVGNISDQAASNGNYSITLMDLADYNNNFKISGMSEESIRLLDFRDSEGNSLVAGEDYFIVEAADGGYYINGQIPEPSEIAAICGLFAILVALRRRSK